MKCFFWLKILSIGVAVSLVSGAGQAAEFEATLVDSKGVALKDAVVALVPGTPVDYSSLPTAIMDQHQNMFEPGVLAIRVNTQVRFPNRDDVRHHVYSFSPAKKFELRLYHGLTAEPVLFDKAGTVVLGCNIHDSMVAYIYVVETDYFAVANEQGRVRINAPAGDYQLEIYHPRMNNLYPPSPVQLTDQQTLQQNISVTNLTDALSNLPSDELSNLF